MQKRTWTEVLTGIWIEEPTGNLEADKDLGDQPEYGSKTADTPDRPEATAQDAEAEKSERE